LFGQCVEFFGIFGIQAAVAQRGLRVADLLFQLAYFVRQNFQQALLVITEPAGFFCLAFRRFLFFRQCFFFVFLFCRDFAFQFFQQVAVTAGMFGNRTVAGHVNNRCDHAVDKVAVVAYQQNGSLVFVQNLLQKVKRIHVQIVGRFVQYQKIGGLSQRDGQHQTVFFAAGKRRNRTLRLIGTKQKVFQISHYMTVRTADENMVAFVAKRFPKCFFRVQGQPVLVKIGFFQIFADTDMPAVRFQTLGQQLDKRGLSRAVGADDTDFVAFDDTG